MLRIFTRAGSESALNTCAVASASASAIAGVPRGTQQPITCKFVISMTIVSKDIDVSRESGFGLRFQLVPDAVTRLDERVAGRFAVDLVSELAYEDVDRPVTVPFASSPELLQELIAAHDATALERQRVQEPELGRRQLRALSVEVGLHIERVDPQLLDLDRIAALLVLLSSAPPGCDCDPRHELLHRERLHQVVVGSDLECVHAVVLGASRADDDDGRADALGAGRLDQLP